MAEQKLAEVMRNRGADDASETDRAMISCPFCSEQILSTAKKCKHCGEFVDEKLRKEANPPRQLVQLWSPGVAALLSLVIPGAGQMYKGQVFNGLFWLFITVIGYLCFILPGIALHLLCIIGAAMGDPTKFKGTKTIQ